MGHLMYGYRLGLHGKIDYRQFDSDRFPSDWFDSPEKIPNKPKEQTPEATAVQLPTTTPADGLVYGERRRSGWPLGKRRK